MASQWVVEIRSQVLWDWNERPYTMDGSEAELLEKTARVRVMNNDRNNAGVIGVTLGKSLNFSVLPWLSVDSHYAAP